MVDNGALLTLDSCPLRTSDPDDACDLPKTPEYKVYLGPQYKARLGSGALAHLQCGLDIHRGALQRPRQRGTAEARRHRHRQRLHDLRRGGRAWTLSIGGTNLTDERYIVSGQNQGGVQVIDASFNRPREWYATLRVNMK